MKPYEAPKAEVVLFSKEDSACLITTSGTGVPQSTELTVPQSGQGW